MTGDEFQVPADTRAADAAALLAASRWSAAYYLAGYAVECGLKACVMRRVGREEGAMLFENRRFQSDYCFTHDLEKLFKAADLWSQFQRDRASAPLLDRHWVSVKAWNEQSRYAVPDPLDASRALDLLTSVADPTHGVLQWIRRFW